MIPVRIQMKRTKGFDLQEYSQSINGLPAVLVTRPGKWGNPLRLIGDMIYIDASYRRKILDPWVLLDDRSGRTIKDVIFFYEMLWSTSVPSLLGPMEATLTNPDLIYWHKKFQELDLSELSGKNLGCFCHLDQLCHADVLIKKVLKNNCS